MPHFLPARSALARAAALVVASTVLAAAGTALACTIPLPTEFVTSADPSDTTAPLISEAAVFDLKRGSDGQGCSGTSSCGDIAMLALDLAATDDVSPGAEIGFRVRVVEGSLPHGALPVSYTADVSATRFLITWTETDAESFDAVLEIVAVDRAGNRSAPRLLSVDGGGLACSATNGGFGAALGFAPLALVLALITRRAQRRRR